MTMLNVGVQVRHKKANEQARLRWKVCFISDAGNRGGGGQMSAKVDSPSTDNQEDKSFYRLREGGYTQKQHSQLLRSSSSRSLVV